MEKNKYEKCEKDMITVPPKKINDVENKIKKWQKMRKKYKCVKINLDTEWNMEIT